MTLRLNPYLHFDDQARQALGFYHQVFGGELRLSTFGEYGMTGADADKIMHGQLETPAGFTLMASDAPEGMERSTGSAISVSLSGDDEAQLRGYWDRLSDGGEVGVPLDKQMWGDLFGLCTDRFGVAWMVNIAPAAVTGTS